MLTIERCARGPAVAIFVDNIQPQRLNAIHMERHRTLSIQHFIVDHVDVDPKGIARRVAQAYGISRQAANRHLDALVMAGVLDQAGQTRARAYALRRTTSLSREFRVTPVLSADRVWGEHAVPLLAGDRAMVREACRGTFKELVENAIAHAGAQWISFELATTARQIDLTVVDDGRGAFVTLAEKLRIATPRGAAEEFVRRARARSMDSPGARLVLLARGVERFEMTSSGITCEFDAANDTWTVREDDRVSPGTTVTCEFRRVPSHAPRGAISTAPSRS